MAEPIPFREANRELKAPVGQEAECSSLHTHTDGRVSTSCWRFTKPELDEIMRTGVVWLHVWSGVTQPPVCASAFKPEMR